MSPPPATSVLVLLGAALLATRSADGEDGYRVGPAGASEARLLAGDDDAWAAAASVSWGTEPYATAFRALHGPRGLFVRFDAGDPSPWHTYTERDDPLWREEVVEIFIDPDGDGRNYAEIEISPANVVCDLLVMSGQPDLRNDIDWDFEGLRSAVRPLASSGETVGWSAVVLLPWAGFARLPGEAVPLPPRPGDRWSFNVFRIKRPYGPRDPRREVLLAAWSPVPGTSFHVPEVFRPLEFGQ